MSTIEIKPFEIGKRYRIPCVQWNGFWTPILGPLHEDVEHIGFKEAHWHIDFRFVSRRQWVVLKEYWDGYGRVHGKVICNNKAEGEVLVRRVKCQRAMPEFPTHVLTPNCLEKSKPVAVHWLPKLESAYAGAKLKCSTCPHRGLPLDGLPVNDGVVVCPGHGLAWNVNTGELVRRAPLAV